VVASMRWRRMSCALAASVLFAAAATTPVAPVLLRNAAQFGSLALTEQSGEHLAFWIVPLVAQCASGIPYEPSVAHMRELYRQRLADRGVSEESNPFLRASIKVEVAREAMVRLPAAAFVESWLEGMAMNLGVPALLADPRVRALPKPSFYGTPGASLWQRM